jgi:DNA polymerase phi
MEGEEDLSAPSDGDSGSEHSDGSDSDSEDASEDVDDQDEQGDVDPEFRRKVAEALGAIGFKEDDSESDDSSEVLMDDDQMMQLDDKLADIFRAQSTVNKGKIGQQGLR